MSGHHDVIIIGSGPAGVSAAFPLLDAGLKVLMIDGGQQATASVPSQSFMHWRENDPEQWKTMVGQDFHALRQADAASPKLRVPTHAHVFAGFAQGNDVHSQNFMAIGSLATGGLSNAWGCGVATFQGQDLHDFPFASQDLQPSYEVIGRRIGISGQTDDELSGYFGVDAWAQAPTEMDELHRCILNRHQRSKRSNQDSDFKMGRPRLAVLTQDLADRKACNLSGNCMWGCAGGSLYSATQDLATLKHRAGFEHKPGLVAEHITRHPDGHLMVHTRDKDGQQSLQGHRVFLAAGTLASSRLAMRALGLSTITQMQSCPTAAFMLWSPKHLGRPRSPTFGLGQLSFTLGLTAGINGFGSLFNPATIPLAEFVRHVPLGKRLGIDFMAALVTSCSVGNVFLPGTLSKTRLSLDETGALNVEGHLDSSVTPLMKQARERLASVFLKRGALMLPGSFKIGLPGSDIHHACSLPMRHRPERGETTPLGELAGFEGVHAIDGASLSYLPEKSHTMTIMANADRIARTVAVNINR
jgi:hypothetical protein